MHALRTTHLLAVYGTVDHGLFFFPSADASIIVIVKRIGLAVRILLVNYWLCSILGTNLIAWCSKRQPTISKSSTEAENCAPGYIIVETIWLRKLLFDVAISIATPARLHFDNMSATYMTTNLVQHGRSKHIDVNYHFVREWVSHGDLIIPYIPTGSQIADMFSMSSSSQQFLYLKSKLSVYPTDQPEGA